MKLILILFVAFTANAALGQSDGSTKAPSADQKRNEILMTRKILRCQNVRRDNANSGVTGFWGGVLMLSLIHI